MKDENNPFKDIDKQALCKYNVRLKKYGESWKTIPLYKLQRKLQEETSELLDARDGREIYEEALDVINVARMLAERTKNIG